MSGFRRRNVEIWGLSAANVRPIDQIDLYPVKRLILRAQIEHQSCKPIVLKAAIWPVGGAALVPTVENGMGESGFGRGLFRHPTGGAHRGGQRCLRVKLTSEAFTCRWGARQLLSRLQRPEWLARSPLALFCVASAPMASERLGACTRSHSGSIRR